MKKNNNFDLCLDCVDQREWGVRVWLQVLCDGGGRHGPEGHAHEEKDQAEKDCGEEDRVDWGSEIHENFLANFFSKSKFGLKNS